MDFDNAYIIHSRPFKETSLILELFTLAKGRIAAVMQGAYRKPKETKGYLQGFIPLSVHCVGNNNLKTVRAIEPSLQESIAPLTGERLYSGLYLNELLLYLVNQELPMPELYDAYESCIKALRTGEDVEIALRHFEKTLLEAMGYALLLDFDATTGEPVNPDYYYRYDPELGPSFHSEMVPKSKKNTYLGRHLLALHLGKLETKADKLAAKQIMRQAINRQLGGKVLNSRALFVNSRREP